MPISYLFKSDYETVEGDRFSEFPHTTKFGLPSENSRITGFSLQVFFNLGYNHAEKKELEDIVPETKQ